MMILKNALRLAVVIILSVSNSMAQSHTGHNHGSDSTNKIEDKSELSTASKGKIWTCSMHPQIKLSKAGKCPLCHMDLILVESSEGQEEGVDAASLALSPIAEKLSEVEESPVEQKWVSRNVRLVGLLDYDETQVKHITAWVPGRVQRMFVDYSGIEVSENDHMVELYSPELIAAQEELIQAARSLARVRSGGSSLVKNASLRTLAAARDKLRLLGLSDSQVGQIEKRGSSKDSVVIYAPMEGTVVSKHINEGMYVQEGTRIYTVAKLTHLWLKLDAYESDLPWVTYGQEVEFRAEALPGETFTGIVSFIQPFLNRQSRTVKVRVNVDNSNKRLKPGMFVTAIVKANIDRNSQVISPSFLGKHICPMHPEVVSDSPGTCSICGMDLKKSEDIPFIKGVNKRDAEPPIVIPASAPLITGTRAVVYVKNPETSRYQGRVIELGPRAGEYFIVRSGLDVGEIVVSKGAFKIDADLQIRGATSMMNPTGGSALTEHSGH